MGKSADGKPITPWKGSWAQLMDERRLAGLKPDELVIFAGAPKYGKVDMRREKPNG